MLFFKMRRVFLILAGVIAIPASQLRASSELKGAADELIGLIEKADALTKSKKESWQELTAKLRLAASQAETPAGFRLSASRILASWEGKGIRILDTTDAQYYALGVPAPRLREAGAWYAAKGSKWHVKYVSNRPNQAFHRGDAIVDRAFHPVTSWSDANEQEVTVLEQPLANEQKRKVKVRTTTLEAWALAESQAASSILPLENKRLCLEKSWLWLSAPVSTFLQSKVKYDQDNCDALIVDLRDSFGEGSKLKPMKGQRKIPVFVLVNQETREGAVSFALALKEELGAAIWGEPTAPKLLPQESLAMKELPWQVVVYASAAGSLLPDQLVTDSWIYSGGIDTLRDALIQDIKKTLR